MEQKVSELELEIQQKLSELKATNEFAKLEQRFTEDDLAFAWDKGYEARVNEESEGFLT